MYVKRLIWVLIYLKYFLKWRNWTNYRLRGQYFKTKFCFVNICVYIHIRQLRYIIICVGELNDSHTCIMLVKFGFPS